MLLVKKWAYFGSRVTARGWGVCWEAVSDHGFRLSRRFAARPAALHNCVAIAFVRPFVETVGAMRADWLVCAIPCTSAAP